MHPIIGQPFVDLPQWVGHPVFKPPNGGVLRFRLECRGSTTQAGIRIYHGEICGFPTERAPDLRRDGVFARIDGKLLDKLVQTYTHPVRRQGCVMERPMAVSSPIMQRSDLEFHLLLVERVRRVVSHNDVYRAMHAGLLDRFYILHAPQGGVHLRVRVKERNHLISKGEVVRGRFTRDFQSSLLGIAHQGNGTSGADMCHVVLSARELRESRYRARPPLSSATPGIPPSPSSVETNPSFIAPLGQGGILGVLDDRLVDTWRRTPGPVASFRRRPQDHRSSLKRDPRPARESSAIGPGVHLSD